MAQARLSVKKIKNLLRLHCGAPARETILPAQEPRHVRRAHSLYWQPIFTAVVQQLSYSSGIPLLRPQRIFLGCQMCQQLLDQYIIG